MELMGHGRQVGACKHRQQVSSGACRRARLAAWNGWVELVAWQGCVVGAGCVVEAGRMAGGVSDGWAMIMGIRMSADAGGTRRAKRWSACGGCVVSLLAKFGARLGDEVLAVAESFRPWSFSFSSFMLLPHLNSCWILLAFRYSQNMFMGPM